MAKQKLFFRMIAFIIVFLLAMGIVKPFPVFAESDSPDTSPNSPVQGGEITGSAPASFEDQSYASSPELDLSAIVATLAANSTILIDSAGASLPLASQQTALILATPSAWYLCSTGVCSYTTITLALASFSATGGTGTINVTNDYAGSESLLMDGASLLTLTGLVRDNSAAGTKPIITGDITIQGMLKGFTLQGIDINGRVSASLNNGLLKFRDLSIHNTTANYGLQVTNHLGAVELQQVDVSHNPAFSGVLLDNSAGVRGIKILNSTFDGNGSVAPASGLVVVSKGLIEINGVSASNNFGNGGEFSSKGLGLTIRNSVFNFNSDATLLNEIAYGIWTPVDAVGNYNLDNVFTYGNEEVGMLLQTVTGTIILNNTNSSGNYEGAILDTCLYGTGTNCTGVGLGTIRLTNSSFNENDNSGLTVRAKGEISLTNVNANQTTGAGSTGLGAYLDNQRILIGVKAITISNSKFNENQDFGLKASSKGQITLKGVQAIDNVGGSAFGAELINTFGTTAGITISGLSGMPSAFTGNGNLGLNVLTRGNILISDVNASSNYLIGAIIQNTFGTGSISITRSHFDDSENGPGLMIASKSIITLYGVTASGNAHTGATLENQYSSIPRSVIISKSSFNGNGLVLANNGLRIQSKGTITLNNVSANNNPLVGASLTNNFSGFISPVLIIGSLGVNTFSNNMSHGLVINSNGAVTIKASIVTGNLGLGGYIDNTGGIGPVSIITSNFDFNVGGDPGDHGLNVLSNGNITLSSFSASGNTNAGGIKLDNSGSPVPRLVTLSNGDINSNTNGNGLDVNSRGTIRLTNVRANFNIDLDVDENVFGASLVNDSGTAAVLVLGTTYAGSYFGENDNTGLYISSNGPVSIQRTIIYENGTLTSHHGLILDNHNGSGIVSITNSSFNDNTGSGMYVRSSGTITLTNLHADFNALEGIDIDNASAITTLPGVTITKSTFYYNGQNGLKVLSKGAIMVKSMVVQYNQNGGAVLDNRPGTTAGVTILGTYGRNQLFNNTGSLSIFSKGAIFLSGLDTDQNSGVNAILLDNTFGSGSITLTGNKINTNSHIGLLAKTNGILTVSMNVVSGNGGVGMELHNDETVTAKAVNIYRNTFSINGDDGLQVYAFGNITLNNLVADKNDGLGVYLDTCVDTGSGCTSSGMVTVLSSLGTNLFTSNNDDGIQIHANGNVVMAGITARGNAGEGLFVDNCQETGGVCSSTGTVSLTKSYFNNNLDSGIHMVTGGKITFTSVQSMMNGFSSNLDGADLDSNGQSITINSSIIIGNGRNGIRAVNMSGAELTLNSSYWFGNDQNGGVVDADIITDGVLVIH
jgi:hypothetical protein